MDHKALIGDIYKGILQREPEPGALEHWEAQLQAGLGVDGLLKAVIDSDEFIRLRRGVASLFVPPGHFYSPIVDVEEIRERFLSTGATTDIPGIAIDKDAHLVLWHEFLPYLRQIPFPERPAAPYRYYFENPAFSYGDASILYAMLRRFRPRRLVEVGSGFSSACAVDTIDLYLDGQVDVAFVEPYPELLISLLGEQVTSRFALYPTGVQQAALAIFERLGDGDFLFIDSTHVLKTGSDVCHELFTILPALKPGVFIHFHDISWPFEYGADWVLRENRSWNEIYALRAFLMYNDAFETVFFNDYFVRHCRGVVQEGYPAMLKNGGGSIWLRKRKPATAEMIANMRLGVQ